MLFTDCMKAELGINMRNIDKFNFNKKKIKPRVLIGLNLGNLLAHKLTEKERMEVVWSFHISPQVLKYSRLP
jgi:hypothetical protein